MTSIAEFDTLYSGKVTSITLATGGAFILKDNTRTPSGIQTKTLNGSTIIGTATDLVDTDNRWLSNEWNNFDRENAALEAHVNTQKTYDYFRLIHNRKSYDGSNGSITNFINYGNALNNAFYTGGQLIFGQGDGRYLRPTPSLDIVAHEFGHGVMETSANLVYEKESGALNEGVSDIWGSAVEDYNGATGGNVYRIGEQIDIRVDANSGLRYLDNPKIRGYPTTWKGQFWVEQDGCIPTVANDFCGVHRNSSVLNFWYYLLSNGGSGINDNEELYNITGIGITKAAKIVYRAQTVYLPSYSNFGDMRVATMQSAQDIYGGASIEQTQTSNAWYAVGVPTGASGPVGGTGSSSWTGPTIIGASILGEIGEVVVGFDEEHNHGNQQEIERCHICTNHHKTYTPKPEPQPEIREKKIPRPNSKRGKLPTSNKERVDIIPSQNQTKFKKYESTTEDEVKELKQRIENIEKEKKYPVKEKNIDIEKLVKDVEERIKYRFDDIENKIKDKGKRGKSVFLRENDDIKQGEHSVAIGYDSGNDQGNYSLSLGSQSGKRKQRNFAVALGFQAGFEEQKDNSVSIGNAAGYKSQECYSVAIGNRAGFEDQNCNCVSIGSLSGNISQGKECVAIGALSGNYLQGRNSVAVGDQAGNSEQGEFSVAIGSNAGHNQLGNFSIAIGTNANRHYSRDKSTIVLNAMGKPLNPTNPKGLFIKPVRQEDDITDKCLMFYHPKSGEVIYNQVEKYGVGPTGPTGIQGEQGRRGRQGSRGVIGPRGIQGVTGATGPIGPLKIGEYHGDYLTWDVKQSKWCCGDRNVNMGEYSGYLNQNSGCIALGIRAGYINQMDDSISIGKQAGETAQGKCSVAIGRNAGKKAQKEGCISIGEGAGQIKQGRDSIAIGRYAGQNNQANNSIILNASGNIFSSKTEGLFVKPIRKGKGKGKGKEGKKVLIYDEITGEITFASIEDVIN